MDKHSFVVSTLKGLLLLPLARATEHYEGWTTDIERCIEQLETRKGLPDNDPMRYKADGSRVPQEELDQRLDAVIESWPLWSKEKKKLGWKKTYQKDR